MTIFDLCHQLCERPGFRFRGDIEAASKCAQDCAVKTYLTDVLPDDLIHEYLPSGIAWPRGMLHLLYTDPKGFGITWGYQAIAFRRCHPDTPRDRIRELVYWSPALEGADRRLCELTLEASWVEFAELVADAFYLHAYAFLRKALANVYHIEKNNGRVA